MKCSFAEWRGPLPVSNFRAGPSPKIGLAYHVIVGSLSSADGEFHQPGASLSAHFGIGGPGDLRFADGKVVQWLDTDDDCFAQGAGNYPPTAYISVEVAGDPSTEMTPAQVASLARIVAWASSTHDFPIRAVEHGQSGVTTHCHYPSGDPDPAWGNHPCPGKLRLAQMGAVLAAARPQPPEDPMMYSRDPKDGSVVFTDETGATFNFNADGSAGGHFLGNLVNHPDYNAGAGKAEGPCVGVTHWDDGLRPFSGIILWTRDAQGAFHPYNFQSDGRHIPENA